MNQEKFKLYSTVLYIYIYILNPFNFVKEYLDFEWLSINVSKIYLTGLDAFSCLWK